MHKIYPLGVVVFLLLAGCSDDDAPEKTTAVTTQMQPMATNTDIAQGQAVYEYWCAPCHTGSGNAGTKALRARLGDEKSVLLERTDLNAMYIKTVVRHGFQMMPPFKMVEISEEQLDAVAAYVASNGGKNKQTAQSR